MRIVRPVYSERGECPQRESRPRNGEYTDGQLRVLALSKLSARSVHTDGETGGEMADGTSASNRTGVSRFVTSDFAVQQRFSAASTLQEQTSRVERQ